MHVRRGMPAVRAQHRIEPAKRLRERAGVGDVEAARLDARQRGQPLRVADDGADAVSAADRLLQQRAADEPGGADQGDVHDVLLG